MKLLRIFNRWKQKRREQNLHAPSSIPVAEPLADNATWNQILGRNGEEAACRLLVQEGYLILHRNWRASHYEVDIIAQKAHVIAFVEVKTRSSMEEKDALDAIDSEKLYNFQRAIGYFRRMYPPYAQFLYHVDAITVLGSGEPFVVRHYENPYHKRYEDRIPKRDHRAHRGRKW